MQNVHVIFCRNITGVFVDGELLVIVAVDDLVGDVRVPTPGLVPVNSLHLEVGPQPEKRSFQWSSFHRHLF